jgi:hypothetical protein
MDVPPALRRVLPWLGGAVVVQGGLALAGRVLARRHDEGDDTSPGIRRVRLMGRTQLRPSNPALARLRLDLVMAGAEVDLVGAPRVPGGVDLTLRAFLAGAEIRVPGDWRVWLHCTGPGAVSVDPRLEHTDDERGADLRVHAVVGAAGVSVERA